MSFREKEETERYNISYDYFNNVFVLFLLSINVPIAIGLAVTTIIAMVMKT